MGNRTTRYTMNNELLKQIYSLDTAAMARARQHWNSIAHPLHSLGLLEDAVVRIAGITGDENVTLDKRCVVVMCADNGVVAEGVTQSDASVTAIVARTMAEGTANINCMARRFGADVIPVNIGIAQETDVPGLLPRKIAYGTANIAQGAAMTRQQAETAISYGMEIVRQCAENGYHIIVTGEMGIGNTTTSAAIASVLLGRPAEELTGRGAGLDTAGLQHKIEVIKQAIAVNHPNPDDPLEILASLGGFDIAGLVGVYLGGAVYRVPVVIDGFISAVAAALAWRIASLARDFQLCSHVSQEPAGRAMLEYLGQEPLITAQMRLGEGTGGILLLPLLDGALAVYHSDHSFERIHVENYRELT